MKTSKKLILFVGAAMLLSFGLLSCMSSTKGGDEKTKGVKMIEPADLVATINNPKAKQPIIFSMGPFPELKGAIDIGPGQDKDNLEKLRKAVSKLPKDQDIVIYCGCCPFAHCPNVFPAIKMLNDMGFTNHKLLDLSTNFKTDWINKNYPMK
jgi:hypothetical protein